jgi:hypothetical protein
LLLSEDYRIWDDSFFQNNLYTFGVFTSAIHLRGFDSMNRTSKKLSFRLQLYDPTLKAYERLICLQTDSAHSGWELCQNILKISKWRECRLPIDFSRFS